METEIRDDIPDDDEQPCVLEARDDRICGLGKLNPCHHHIRTGNDEREKEATAGIIIRDKDDGEIEQGVKDERLPHLEEEIMYDEGRCQYTGDEAGNEPGMVLYPMACGCSQKNVLSCVKMIEGNHS
jgi:hypothetical protein